MGYHVLMLIFIDESGDPGFKVGQGSSNAFVIACACFEQPEHAEETAQNIKQFRHSLGWGEHQEFKFSKTSKDIRARFLSAVAASPFQVHAIVFQKKNIYSPNLQNNKDRFYNFATRQILDTFGSQLDQANIKIDGSGDRDFRRNIEKYLRTHLSGKIGKFAFANSKTNTLIQLADMCAGAVSRSFSDKSDREIYTAIIKKRISNVWDFK